MINSILKAHWLELWRDRLALFLVFVLPVIFFSVFAMIFGGSGGGGGSSKPADLKVVILDLDDSTSSRAMLNSLNDMDGVNTISVSAKEDAGVPTEADAVRMVRTNKADAAVIFPQGIEDSIGQFVGDRPAVKVIYDAANPMAQNMLAGVLQGSAFTAVPEVMIEKGLKQFEAFGGPLSESQNAAVAQFRQLLKSASVSTHNSENDAESSEPAVGLSMNDGLIRIETVSAQQTDTKKKNTETGSMVAYYAASVAVMFLMFSMAGAASSLLELQENGTLDRLISGQMSIAQLVVSNWLFFVLSGIAQLIVMFVFAALVFDVDLTSGPVLLGCCLMTVVTSMASASFIIMLATFCHSRKQLESISTTIILIMSAFGGSMIPRPFLPEFIRETSKLTFNGWALDGFLKVLWYYDPTQNILVTLQWHLVVILVMAAVFLYVATWRAKQWAVS